MRWTIRYGGHTWTNESVNVGGLITIAEYLGVDNWSTLNPVSGPKVLAAYLSVLLAHEREVPLEVASTVVFAMSTDELLDTVTVE